MKLSVDNQQKLTATLIMILEFYKVMMGTFLVIFVPQKCNNHVCSLSDNVTRDTLINKVSLFSNFTTFIAVLAFYGIEIKRENWCINYLDIDPDKSNNFLDDEIEDYPIIKTDMLNINKTYLNTLYISSSFLIINFGLSSVAIANNYAGSNTLTSLISFILLITIKLYSAYNVGMRSVQEERAFSGYMTIARTYNTIDEDYRIQTSESSQVRPRSNAIWSTNSNIRNLSNTPNKDNSVSDQKSLPETLEALPAQSDTVSDTTLANNIEDNFDDIVTTNKIELTNLN